MAYQTPDDKLRAALTRDFFESLGLGLHRCPVPTRHAWLPPERTCSAYKGADRGGAPEIVFHSEWLWGATTDEIRGVWLHEYAHALMDECGIDEMVKFDERHVPHIYVRRGHHIRFAATTAALYAKWDGFSPFMFHFKFYDMSGAGGINRDWSHGQALDFIMAVARETMRRSDALNTPQRLCSYVLGACDRFERRHEKVARRRRRRQAVAAFFRGGRAPA